MTAEAVSALAGYVLGSIPATAWLARVWGDADLARAGSGNPGATNVLRLLGWGPALAALALDSGKGALAVVAVAWAGAQDASAGVAAAAGAVAGHVWPIFAGFRGGKGVATAAGALAVLCLPALVPVLSIFALVAVATRRVSAGSLAAACALPPVLLALRSWTKVSVDDATMGFALALAAFLVWTHRENLVRLVQGREPPVF